MIDESVVEAFEADGAVAVRGLVDDEWIESLRDAIPDILQQGYDPQARTGARRPGSPEPQVVQSDGMWKDCEPFRQFLFESPVGAVAAAAVRSATVRLYEDLLLYREAGPEHGALGWHRDSVHWPIRGTQLVNVWFTLEPVTASTGALRVVTGSHLDGDDVANEALGARVEPDAARIATFETEPGDVVLFHPRALHSGYGSSPDRPRRTFTIRFMGDDVRWRPRRAYFHEWMRECGLRAGDPIDHPGLPVVWSTPVPA